MLSQKDSIPSLREGKIGAYVSFDKFSKPSNHTRKDTYDNSNINNNDYGQEIDDNNSDDFKNNDNVEA